jgi:AGZA family xanthine/uracil permease-like MFS transporter
VLFYPYAPASAVGSLLVGAFARYPIALAPGMGLNAYFAYVGALFVALTLAGVSKRVVASIPTELYSAIAAGFGLLLALIDFRNSGIVVSNASTMVAMGNLRSPNTLLAIGGLLLIAALHASST